MNHPWSKLEIVLLTVLVALLGLAFWGPSVVQPASQHDFADQRLLWGIPFARDVLSNLSFALWGLLGIGCLARQWRTAHQSGPERSAVSASQYRMAALFFTGLLLTAAGSGYYHWQPDDAGLVPDRLGMAVAYAGLLGLAAGGRISARAGVALALAVLVFGPVSVAVWAVTGNVTPWLVLQFGGLALVLWLACLQPLQGALAVRWGSVILIYTLAKLLELGDHWVYELAGHAVSGHSLKHLVASCAAWPVLVVLMALRGGPKSGQNPVHKPGTRHAKKSSNKRSLTHER